MATLKWALTSLNQLMLLEPPARVSSTTFTQLAAIAIRSLCGQERRTPKHFMKIKIEINMHAFCQAQGSEVQEEEEEPLIQAFVGLAVVV